VEAMIPVLSSPAPAIIHLPTKVPESPINAHPLLHTPNRFSLPEEIWFFFPSDLFDVFLNVKKKNSETIKISYTSRFLQGFVCQIAQATCAATEEMAILVPAVYDPQ
jgi:hypothetical protein